MILRLISEHKIETQEELQERLQKAGFAVTQATISRDIRELRINKVTNAHGQMHYAILSPEDPDVMARFVRVLRDGYMSCAPAQNLLVIKTVIGMAMAVATALDGMEFPEPVGCIAGDDTIFVATHSCDEAKALARRIIKIAEE